MKSTLNEVVVHIDENIDDATLSDLEQGIRRDEGIVSVGHRPDQHHLMMVVYNSDILPANSILHHFQDRGLHAQLIGM